MNEEWKPIEMFDDYEVSSFGRICNSTTGRFLALNTNQYGVLQVGLMRKGQQYHRSVPLLVAKAFIPEDRAPFDTPINLDGDRTNNRVENLVWRPRWFAIKYNQQFKNPPEHHISGPLADRKTGEVSENSFECAKRYGLLENDIVFATLNRTYVWPTYQKFGILER